MTNPKAKSPRLLFLVTEDWYFWAHWLSLAKATRDAGYEVIVATSPGALREQIEAEGFHFYPLRLRRESLNPFSEVNAIIDIISLYRQWQPNLVHHVALKPIIYGSLAAKVTGIAAVVNAITGLGHIFVDTDSRVRVLRQAIEFVYRICLAGERTKVIFQNPDDLQLFLRKQLVKESQTALILGVGVDIDLFHPSPETPGIPIILLAARMLWAKGIGELIEAGKILKERQVPHKIVLAGIPDTSNPSYIPEDQLKAWQEEGLAEWIGYQSDMPSTISQSHIVCLPSYYREGTPTTLLEAAACARPIVTTDAPGCREVVQDGLNGFLVPVRNASVLADRLQVLLLDSELRRRMGEASRKRVLKSFTKDIVIQETLSLYKTLL